MREGTRPDGIVRRRAWRGLRRSRVEKATGPVGAAPSPLTRSSAGGACCVGATALPDSGQLPQLQRQRLESDGYPEQPVDPCILAVFQSCFVMHDGHLV